LFFDGCKTNIHNATELDGVRPGAAGRRLHEDLMQPWEGLSRDASPGGLASAIGTPPPLPALASQVWGCHKGLALPRLFYGIVKGWGFACLLAQLPTASLAGV